jgi:hypothetical protein
MPEFNTSEFNAGQGNTPDPPAPGTPAPAYSFSFNGVWSSGIGGGTTYKHGDPPTAAQHFDREKRR